MERKLRFISIITTAVVIFVLMIFLSSPLKPYTTIVLSILLLVSLWLYVIKNEKFTRMIYVFILVIAIIYIILPFKIVIPGKLEQNLFFKNGDGYVRIMPISYGLILEGRIYNVINDGYFPGGDVIGLLNPKYVILIKR